MVWAASVGAGHEGHEEGGGHHGALVCVGGEAHRAHYVVGVVCVHVTALHTPYQKQIIVDTRLLCFPQYRGPCTHNTDRQAPRPRCLFPLSPLDTSLSRHATLSLRLRRPRHPRRPHLRCSLFPPGPGPGPGRRRPGSGPDLASLRRRYRYGAAADDAGVRGGRGLRLA